MMYPTAEDLRRVKMARCQSSLSWKIVMMMKLISNITRRLDYIKNSNIATWPKDHPDWVDPDVAVSPRASKSPHAAACM
eukprot:8203059-Ditylum_brightwellii.AAC.1